MSNPGSLQALPQLPTELIEQIFSSSTDYKTLAAICSVSKLGQRVATPLLYHTLGIADQEFYPGDEAPCGQETVRYARSLQLQCRTLIENRNLAKHVTEVHQYANGHIKHHQHGMGIIEPEECRKVLSKDLKLPSNVVDALEGGLSRDNPNGQTDEAHFMLLLALCPQVSILRLEGGLGILRALPCLNKILIQTHDLLQTQQGEAIPTPASGLYTIREIHLESSAVELAPGAEDIVSLLRFPGLQKLTTDSLHESISKGSRFEAHYLDSSVKTIEVQQCFAKDEDLKALFMACPNVESLSIEWAMREDNFRRFDWSNIGDYIVENMTRLKHLSFDHHPDLDPTEPDAEDMMEMMKDDFRSRAHLPGLGVLKELDSLETLSLSKIALFGTHNDDRHHWDMEYGDEDDDPDVQKHTLDSLLPESLKELTVHCEGLRFGRDDRALLSLPRAMQLQNFTIMTCMKDHWISTRDGEDRTEASRAAEIERERKRAAWRARRPPPRQNRVPPSGSNDEQPGRRTEDIPLEIRRAMLDAMVRNAGGSLPPFIMDELRADLKL